MGQDRLDDEIDANYDFFRRTLTRYIPDHSGQYALLHDRQIIGFFDKVGQASAAGNVAFPDGMFSIQQVMDEPADFGFFSHVSY